MHGCFQFLGVVVGTDLIDISKFKLMYEMGEKVDSANKRKNIVVIHIEVQ